MKINIHFFIFLAISIIAIIIDYLVYFTGLNYLTSLIIATLSITIISFILIIKKKIILKSDFHKKDILFFCLLLFFMFTRIWIPDISYDVNNYHIYLQQNIKIQKITFDFFAGKNINGFLFPLGDRMHYIFRYLLGYRLGTILSYYAYVVMFYQFKNILKYLINDNKKDNLISIFGLTIFLPVIMYSWMGTYYIDIFTVVFILEILYLLIKENNFFNDPKYIYYLFVLSGIATGIKITSIILIFPIVLYFFLKRIKNFKIKKLFHYIIGLIIFFIPLALYLYDNYIQTGSILFPYYNNIFKSKYFGLYSWKDSRFGIKNIWYKLIWPFYTGLINQKYGDGCVIKDYTFALGYVFLIITTIINFFKKRKDSNLNLIIILCFITTFTWIQFLEGYMRYGLIVPILYLLLICYIIIKYTKINLFFELYEKMHVLEILCIAILSICIYKNVTNKGIIKNQKYAFKDRTYEKLKLDAPLGVIGDMSYIATLERTNQPIINLDYYLNTSEKSQKLYEEIIDKYDYFYVFGEKIGKGYKKVKNYLEMNNFKIVETKKLTVKELPFIDARQTVYLYKVTKK